jgi:tetratricopeptide (TPR) repeat protein
MGRIRKKSIDRLHREWSQATKMWHVGVPGNYFWVYVLKNGLHHMLIRGEKEKASVRLSDLSFSGALLHWCNSGRGEHYTYVLRFWRFLGLEEAQVRYRTAFQTLQSWNTEHLLFIQDVVEFIRDASWYDLAVDIAHTSMCAHIEILGLEDIQTAKSQIQYALALKRVRRSKEALPIAREGLKTQRRFLDRNNPELYVCINSVASLSSALGLYQQAEELFMEAIENRTRILGEKHHKTLISMASYGFMLHKSGFSQRALSIQRYVFDTRKEVLGENNTKTLLSCYNYASVLMKLGKWDHAYELLVDCLEKREKVLGTEHAGVRKTRKAVQECEQKKGMLPSH